MPPSLASFVTLRAWPQRREARTTRLLRPPRARSSHGPSRPPHPRLTSRDDRASVPLHRGGMARTNHIILKNGSQIFFAGRLDGRISFERLCEFRSSCTPIFDRKGAARDGKSASWLPRRANHLIAKSCELPGQRRCGPEARDLQAGPDEIKTTIHAAFGRDFFPMHAGHFPLRFS